MAGSVSSSLIGSLTQNILGSIGKFFGLAGDPNSKSVLFQALGIGGVGATKYLYGARDFEYELQYYPGLAVYLVKMLKKRKCPYSLDRLITMSNTVLIQVSKTGNRGSVVFIGPGKRLIYDLILIGADLIHIKDEMEILASGGAE